ncbi:MAG: HAMP domain-containing sensor histidine kinase [Peptococcaceae bacterium]|nr:HAMP domain-containing sensor histidine kinase [Peptococcaceae bacterium]
MASGLGTKLSLSYVLISLITLIIMESLFFFAIYQYYITGMEQTLTNNAEASASMYSRYAPTGDIKDKQDFIFENMDSQEKALVEVYDANGHFLINNLGDTENATELTEDYQAAVQGDIESWRGKLDTREAVMSVSVPIYDGKIVVGVLRYVSSMSMVNALLKENFMAVFLIGLVILIAAAIIGRVMSSLILRPIRNLIRVTREITKGNLEAKATVYNNDEIGQLSKAINRMTDEIAQSYKTKNDFISSISHELRTPLTSINGWAETIEDSPEDIETTKMGMEIISRETKRMIRLVNDLLDFSKLQSHRIELELEPIWMNDFLESLYNQFLPRAAQDEVALRLHLGNTNVMIMADDNRLSQVFVNILDNAFKFVKGRAYPEVVIQAHMLDDQVVMTIEDNGPGMSSEELLRVKEKFYKGSSKQSGTGLGLSIANEIVALHNGTFYIDSIRGVGTKVSVVLPFEESTTDEDSYDFESEPKNDNNNEAC